MESLVKSILQPFDTDLPVRQDCVRSEIKKLAYMPRFLSPPYPALRKKSWFLETALLPQTFSLAEAAGMPVLSTCLSPLPTETYSNPSFAIASGS